MKFNPLLAALITTLVASCKPTTRSFDNDLCYVIWDGKTFVEGKTIGNDFDRFSVERYGIRVLEVSIPKKMSAYFGGKNLKKGDKAPPDLERFIVVENIDRISKMCGFQK